MVLGESTEKHPTAKWWWLCCLFVWAKVNKEAQNLPFFPFSSYKGYLSILLPTLMATTTSTPKHTDPATKNKEKKNEETVKDKPDGKKKTTQQK
ncbi:hypothetical protein SAMN00120144_2347 [Hymenobacter roseosalivarius DSM 11622]|uniref:Uncharacterized protein n=1 Tax=Hymenobacter roseosalivarius DSM 11622 TaxID=645990 RepID=A0A1W1VL74_9BACT|nr:hypothetical protein SAMN00120144_2347 [Hymenobacter roseosalivarius DSM 11622]